MERENERENERDFLFIEPPTFEYDDFETAGDDLIILPSAGRADGVLRLTESAPGQLGSAWHPTPFNLASGFTTTFQFQITEIDNQYVGAEGFSFNIHSRPPHNTLVGERGTFEEFSIQFDTYTPGGHTPGGSSRGFIQANFMGENWARRDMGIPGVILPPQPGDFRFNMKDGEVHTITIEVDEDHTLKVWKGHWRRRRVNLILEKRGTYFDHFRNVRVGFGAATGPEFYARHDILRWAFTVSGVRKPPVRPSLVAWWPADGTPEDVIGGHDPVNPDTIEYGEGQFGQAFVTGETERIQIPPAPLLDVGSGHGATIEAWIKQHAPSWDAHIFYWEGGQHLGGLSLMVTGGALKAYLTPSNASGVAIAATEGGLISLGQFHHVALTYYRERGEVKLFVDGQRKVTETIPADWQLRTHGGLYLGYRSPELFFIGLIDEPKIYSRALTEEEIADIYSFGGPSVPTVSLSGRVTSLRGRPLHGITLLLRNADLASESRPGRRRMTNEEGVYTFEGVPTGHNYYLFPIWGPEQYDPSIYDLRDLQRGNRNLDFQESPGDLPASKIEGEEKA